MHKKYTDEELSRAMLLITDQGMSIAEAAKETGVHIRAIQRYKNKYLDNKPRLPKEKPKVDQVIRMKTLAPSLALKESVDSALTGRAKFMEDVFNVKQKLLKQLDKVGGKSQNVDALQRSIKTLNDIEREVTPEGDAPMVHAKTVNVFQLFNQNLEKNGYKGPELTDADIVKGD